MACSFRLLALLFVTALCAGAGRAAEYTYHLLGNAADVEAEKKPEGALLLLGGGEVDDACHWFMQRAGGGDMLVLRVSEADEFNDYLFNRIGGMDSVETVILKNRAASADPRVLALVRNAEGIWLAGGDPLHYVTYLKGTPVAAALEAHMRAGKPLAGTSVGLSVLGEFVLWGPGVAALENPFDARLVFERDFLHLDLLRGVIAEGHFTAPDSLGRALAFLARLLATEKRERLIGLGVEEKTALAINADGSFRIFASEPSGRVWVMMPTKPAEILEANRPLTLRDVRVVALKPGSHFDLKRHVVRRPAAAAMLSVVDGKLSPLP